MRNIYFFGQNKSIVLYPYRNQIYRVTLDGGQMVKPVLISGDYLGELSDAYYRGTVYYCYISRNKEILVKNIMDRIPEYRIPAEEEVTFSLPQLIEWKGRLLLLYLLRREGGRSSQIKGVFPFEEQDFLFPEVFPAETRYSYHLSGGALLLTAAASGKHWIYLLDETGTFQELTDKEKRETEEKTEQEIRFLEEKLQEQTEIIESVKLQYDDLMNTAIQYREEAKKWREKYLTKK